MIEEENINESITSQIRAALKNDYEKIKEANKNYNMNKSIHFNKNSICCHKKNTKIINKNLNDIVKEQKIIDYSKNLNPNNLNNKNDINDLLSIFKNEDTNLNEEKLNLKNFLFSFCNIQNKQILCKSDNIKFYSVEKNFNPNLKINHVKFDQKPIDVDYNSTTDLIVINKDKQYRLRNPHYFEDELKEIDFKGDPFGNPFKRCKEDFENNMFNNNFNVNDNIDIGENYKTYDEKQMNIHISESEKNALSFQINNSVIQRKHDDDLSVFPIRINKKRSRSATTTNSQVYNKLNLNFLYKKNKLENFSSDESEKINEENNYEMQGN